MKIPKNAKLSKNVHRLFFASLVAASLIRASAAELYWSGDGTSLGGAGTWNTTGLNFSFTNAAPFSATWTNANFDTAVFDGTGGAVAFSSVTLNGIMSVRSTGYSFPSGTLTLGAGGATNHTAAGVTHTISGIVAGTGSLTKSGPGVMILNNVNTFTGGLLLNEGTLGWGANTTTIGANSAGVKIVINSNNVVFANSSTSAKNPQQAVDQFADLVCDDSLIANPAGINFTGAQGPWTLKGGDRKISVVGAATLTITGVLTDDGTPRALTKSGSGKLSLANNNNTYSGKTYVTGGILAFSGSDTRLGVTPTGGPVADQLTLDGGTVQSTAALTLDPNRGITITTNNGTIDVNSATFTYNGVIAGPGRLTKSGVSSGTLSLGGANTYSGGTILSGGKLIVGNSQALGSGPITVSTGASGQQLVLTNGVNVANPLTISGNGGVAAQGIIYLNQTSGSATYSGAVTINGSASTGGHMASAAGTELVMAGPITSSVLMTVRNGLVTLSNANNNISAVSIQGGTVKVGVAGALTPTATVDIGANGAGYLDMNGFNVTVAALTKNAQSATVTNGGGGTPTLTVNTTTTNAFAGVLGTDSSFNVVKSGSGIWILGGANAYVGTTLVSGGVLKVTNTTGSATSSGAVTVSANGTLAGNGTASGNVAVSGTIAPGDGVGTLNTGAQTWNGGGHLAIEMSQASGTAGASSGWDLDNITGGLNINAVSGNKFTVDVSAVGLTDFNSSSNYAWVIATASSGISGFSSAAFSVNTSGFTNSFNGSFSVSSSGNNIVLVYTAGSTASAPTTFGSNSAGQGSFQGTPNATYNVQYADALANPTTWLPLTNVVTDGTGFGSFADPAVSSQSKRFYRIKVP
jgi:autotransporter-associated beta strand protein